MPLKKLINPVCKIDQNSKRLKDIKKQIDFGFLVPAKKIKSFFITLDIDTSGDSSAKRKRDFNVINNACKFVRKFKH